MTLRHLSKSGGQALFLVLGLALLAAVQVHIVMTFSGGRARGADRLRSQLAAIQLGRAMQVRIVARLLARPWRERWFRDAPAVDAGLSLDGGTCDTWVGDVPGAGARRMFDVFVWAEREGSRVLMGWRLQHVDDSLDWSAAAALVHFGHLPPTSPLPGRENPLQDEIDRQARERQDEAGPAEKAVEQLEPTRTVDEVLEVLGLDPIGPVRESTQPPDGSPPVPEADYLRATDRGPLPAPPAAPAPPGPPAPPEGLANAVTKYAEPLALADGIEAVLKQQGIDLADPSSSRFFDDYELAMRQFRDGRGQLTSAFDNGAEAILKLIDELADGADKRRIAGDVPTAEASHRAARAVLAYLDTACRQWAAERGLPPPDPATFEPIADDQQAPVETEIIHPATGYVRWWSVASGLGTGAIWRRALTD